MVGAAREVFMQRSDKPSLRSMETRYEDISMWKGREMGMNDMMMDFKDIFKGQTVWIIGKGPSLQYLTKEDIGPGPVIAINTSIIKIEELDLSNPIYAMMKDGGDRRRNWRQGKLIPPDCDHTPNCGDECGTIIKPKRGATLLVHRHESLYCFPDYSPRYVFDWKELGLRNNRFSLVIAIKIGILMGCEKFHFVSCDVHVTGSIESYDPNAGIIGTSPQYKSYVYKINRHLKDLDYKWITPEK